MSSTQTVHLNAPGAAAVVDELRAAFAGRHLDTLLFFCSPHYDLPALAAALSTTFADVPCVVGCTSAGQIAPTGFVRGGLTAVGFSGGDVIVTPYLIEPLSTSLTACQQVGAAVDARRRQNSERGAFGLLLVDGLSMAEEHLAASLYAVLGDIPLVGGSAGDDLQFTATNIYFGGAFRTDRAVFLLCETTLSFSTFKFQHYVPTMQRLVVTSADPDRRVIHELNGMSAIEGYADALGLTVDAVTPSVRLQHPLLVTVDGEDYIRSIQRVGDDGSFHLFCAIEEGVVLRLGASAEAVVTADAALTAARARVDNPQLVIGCDCVLRRLEFEESGSLDAISEVFVKHGVFGFSTYGEQWNGVHVNQTFTGIVLGAHRE